MQWLQLQDTFLRLVRFGLPPDWLLDRPVTDLDSLVGSVLRIEASEKFERAWVDYATSQAEAKDVKKLTKAWAELMELKGSAAGKKDLGAFVKKFTK